MSKRKTLVLIPTELERQLVVDRLDDSLVVELCGFGLVTAGIQTARFIGRHNPDEVLLVGIAGSLSNEVMVGKAYTFSHVACYGIGAGCGSSFQSASDMGWLHWSSPPIVGDVIEVTNSRTPRTLLSCTASSGSLDDAALKLAKYPRAAAEDMEAFSVAAACRLSNTPLRIVRGISNVAGNRKIENWRTAEAMASAIQLALEIKDS